MKSVSRGIIALILVSAILLISDLQNRNVKRNTFRPAGPAKSEALAGRKYILGLCYFAPEASHDELLSGLWMRLEELGFVRDSNLNVKESHSNGEIGNIAPILLNMDHQTMDLVLVTSTPCVTAAVATIRKHPVAFTYCYDPIAAGVGISREDHAKGITGIGSFPPVEKTIQFILETIPGTKKIGTIYNTSEANSRKVVGVMRQLAEKSGFTLVEMPVVNSSEVLQATQVIASKGIDALYVSGDNTALQAFDAIAGVCNNQHIPLIVNDLPFVGKGAFAAIGIGWQSVGYHSGDLIGRLLNGASPDTIPIENYMNEMVAFDEEKAKSLELTIPQKYRTTGNSLPTGIKFRLGLVHFVDSPNSEACEKGIRKALEDKNLRESVDFTLKVYNAQGDISTLNSIAETINNETWDLVFATSTPSVQLLAKKLPNSKIVFTNVGDPLAAGLGESFDDHLPNLCGISTMSDFEGLMKLVQNLHPGMKRAGTVFTPAEINSVSYKNRLEEAAQKIGIKLIAVPANSATEVLDAANSLVAQRIDAFCQISDNLTGSCSSAILKVSLDSKIPYYGFVTNQMDQGAVAVCARDYFQAGYEAGQMGIEVLSGKNPAQIPFRYVEKTDYMICPETAKLYDVPLPDQLFTVFPQLKIVKQ
ncbi:MAG: ABC transporter substrate-binding protein [Bacteroidales bacterium]|nr:ABC transporter substrate-binding protein [Bacteroidales bacterium]